MPSNHELKIRAKALEPVIRIGKLGLNQGVITEIKKQLHKKNLVKVKILKSALGEQDKKEFAEEIAEKTNSELIDFVGLIVVLNNKR